MIANPHFETKGIGDVGTAASGAGGAVGSGLLTAGAIAGGPTNPVGLGLMIAGAATALGGALLHVFGVGVRNPYEDRDVKQLNDLADALAANLQGWQSGTKTTAEQQQRLAAFDYYFANLQQLCSDPGLGANWASGCINDRKPGGKYDWYAMYRTPIANDTASDSGSIIGSAAGLFGGSNILLVGGIALVLGLLISKD